MDRVRKGGLAVIAVQCLALCAWSWVLYHRFALTWDFGVYHQPWYLIAHGNLDPPTTIQTMQFWRNDAEFAIWPLAVLWWIPPHDVMLLWAQDAGVCAAEALGLVWMCRVARKAPSGAWLAATGLALLVISPWIWWSLSFDFHMEAVALPFAVLLARDLADRRRRMWWWVAPVLLAGAPAAVYVLGIGAGAFLCGRRYWSRSMILAATAVTYSGLIVVLHADTGAPLARHYGYLALGVSASYAHGRLASGEGLSNGQMARGILAHPLRIAAALWQKRTDIAASMLPGGAIGVLFRPLLPLITVGLLSAILSAGWRFAQPCFQLLPVYVLLPVGTAAVLSALAARWRRAALVIAALAVLQAAGWAVVWAPQIPEHWLRVSAPAAATLAQVKSEIPSSAEVVASQGVIGPFTGRADVHALVDNTSTPVSRPDVWFVVTPQQGTELQTTVSAMALIGQLAGPMHADLIAHANGVWAFRWRKPAGQQRVRIPDGSGNIPAWAAAGTAGRAALTGPVTSWHAASTGRRGYVSDLITWLEPAGNYLAQVNLTTTGPVNVEVWDDNGQGTLLARRSVPGSRDHQVITLPVDASSPSHEGIFTGWGPFSATFVPPKPGQRLEVRVWSPGREGVDVYRASLKPASP